MLNNHSPSQTATTIVFIDASLSDYHTLQAGIIEGVKSVIIAPNQDGIEQISQILQQHPHTTTIHILSHGSPGCLYLGNSQLNLTNIHNYNQQLQYWADLNILLYGCNVAAGDAGAEFIHKLHQITNATISATATKTGNATLGGNWELEVNIPVTDEINPVKNLSPTKRETLNIPPSLTGKGVRGLGSIFNAETLNTYQGVFAPTLVGNYNTPGNAYGVQIVGNYAYVADFYSGLQIINISNPAAPTLVGNYDTSSIALGVQIVGNYAYVADYNSGLQIINISNPTAPTLVGNYDTSGYARGVQIVGNYAYVADGYSGLQIINISNPTAPTLVGNYDTSGYAEGVQIVGNYAYVADSYSGLQIINISNPTAPTLVGNYDTPDYALGVQIVGNYAYVADYESGLQIIDVYEFTNQAPTNLTLSNSAVAENQIIGTVVGNLSTTDPNTGDTFTYSLVSGTGSTDNSLFTISNNQLKTNFVFDFEIKNSYSIRVKTTDQGGLSFEKQFTIGVTDVNETPTNLTLSTNNIAENQPISTVIGNLSTTDPDTGNTFTYSLVSGTGSTDNSLFTIANNQLKTNSVFDFETKNSYSIRVKTTDQGGLSYEKELTINVNDLNEISGNPLINNGRNPIVGTAGSDYITGGPGAKTITGGLGNDFFVFTNLRDVGQRITDFTVGEDKIVLTTLLSSISYNGTNPIADQYIRFVAGTGINANSTFLQIDRDGSLGSAIFKNFLQLDNITTTQLNNFNNFVF